MISGKERQETFRLLVAETGYKEKVVSLSHRGRGKNCFLLRKRGKFSCRKEKKRRSKDAARGKKNSRKA